MNKYLKFSLIAILIIGIMGVTAVGVASAQTDDPPRPHQALAELLGLTFEELRELIHDGSSLEELAEDAGVDLDAFWQEMHETRQEEIRTNLEERLANGDISQEQYEWMMEGLDNGFLGGGKDPGGFLSRGGSGDGEGIKPFGGRGGFGGGRRPGNWCGMDGFEN